MPRTSSSPYACWRRLAPLSAAPRKPGVHEKVAVSAPTRLDWTFVVASRSLAKPPPAWLGDYDSAKQTYDLFVPTRRNPKAPMPVILFLSPGNDGGGWRAFEKLAKAEGVLVAAPRGAGNDCPGRRRVRIVLDVLDDLRRNYPVDPDQTYIAGFSGGGRIACAVAFALPELFAGVMPICAGGNLRDESWLRRRAADRLSVALLTGEKDFNRGEVERLRGPYLTDVGVRCKVWTQPGLGHAIPNDKTLREAYRWLQAGQPRLVALAEEVPRREDPPDAGNDAGRTRGETPRRGQEPPRREGRAVRRADADEGRPRALARRAGGGGGEEAAAGVRRQAREAVGEGRHRRAAAIPDRVGAGR